MHYKELLKHPKILALSKHVGYWLGGYLIGILFYWFVSDYMESTANDMATEKEQVIAETINLKKLRIDTEAKINEVLKAKAIWKKVQSSRRDGLKIDSMKQIIDALRVKYYLADNISISISAPRAIKDAIKSDTTQIVASSVKLNVSAFTDVLALQFLEEMLATVPGYLTITSIDLSRSSTPVTEGLLNNIAKKVGDPLVTMEVNFLWRDFNDINPSKS